LQRALETGTHPEENAEELGRGIFIMSDWRDAWSTYESPPSNPDLVDPSTGYAEYEIDEIQGEIPKNLVGTLYRNGPGKFGVAGERVQHVLDAYGMVFKVVFPPPKSGSPRRVLFQSKFVETNEFKDEQEAGRFLYRGVFGTGPTSPRFDNRPRNGLNSDPIEPSMLASVFGSAFNTKIKNAANTHVIAWGGKLLALFESGLPYSLDHRTLRTIGEDTLGGVLKRGLPVKIGGGLPSEFTPDFIGGTAHTAHPKVCPKTGYLVGWHWVQDAVTGSLDVTFTEWDENFKALASKTFTLDGCDLAPHDMAITENHIIMNVNALQMNQAPFLLGLKGPAASLAMDGRANITTWVFPRPTASNQFEHFSVQTPPCFSIHFSHAYELETTGNLVAFFSGWPPSDSKDFLGAWGGFAPDFKRISQTFLWRLEIDPDNKECVSLDLAPGSSNVCIEHVVVHPDFNTRRAQYVYGTSSNAVGDSSPPCGYAKIKVETGRRARLDEGEYNNEVDAYWFGTRYFASEPLIIPKSDGDPNKEDQAFLLGVVRDAAMRRDFLAIFDLEQDLREGPVCRLYFKTGIPHGIHGCFVNDDGHRRSIFC
jgi:all-trans-8'-apo-beta-carotenal 15,15'-oxygenase